MISLPRSAKLAFGSLIIFCIFAFTFQLQPSLSRDRLSTQDDTDQYSRERFPLERATDRPSTPLFKVPDNLHLTHDVAIPQNIPPWTQEDTDMLDTTIGFDMKTKFIKEEYGKEETIVSADKLNFAELARAEKLYKSLWNHVHPIYQKLAGRNDRDKEKALIQLAKTHPEIDFLLRLERRLFPWVQYVRQSSFSLHSTFKGRGLVFCAGNNQFEFVVTSIQAVRNRLKSTLPIQVFHMGDGDMSPARQDYLRQMAADIEIIDVTKILDNDYMRLGGWSIKPFAMLASSFEEVMFVDADAYFLQDPAVLFQDPGYLATGALFFYDRTLFPGWTDGSDWLKSITPILSSFPRISRMFRLKSAHEQESGVVLINKKTRFLGLMGTCKMNGKWERDLVSYKIFHGDKETFWIGFEMIQEPYVFMRNYGGVIGELRPGNEKSVCGAQLHQDYRGRPLWWNGGLYRNKNAGVYRYLQFDYWMTGGGDQKHRERDTDDPVGLQKILKELGLSSKDQIPKEPKDANWDFNESCLVGARVNMLTQREKTLANGFVGIDKVAREDSRRINNGEEVKPRDHNWETV
ncbi:hypothetical protein EC957_003795 [Mortierella hygrophila]|uniref:Alpha-1,3-mannosyltransferase n=1 Tax=Mortierella hygrophila TaxID=979708 RepID=A0A9P6FEY4_9FUNG|nr:hypothetical protein EC957_003795 [Mortierella hygrophila]